MISVKLAQLCLRLPIILINIKEENTKIKLKTVYKLSRIKGRLWWLTLYESAHIHQKTKIKKEYYKVKENSAKIRATYLEERDKEADQQVRLHKESKLHTLLMTEKDMEKYRRLHYLLPK